jgi:hypothetical protein
MSEKVEKIKGDIKKIEASIKVYSKKNDATSKKIIQSFKSKLDVFEKELKKAEKEEQSALKKIKIRATSKKVADLKKLISSKKYAIYKNSDVDLERDAARPALPIGKRKSKITGNTYYEYRANRIDVKQPAKRYPKLEHGGELETMSEKEFLQKYWGANVFTEDVSKHFDIKKMSSSNDAKIEKFLEELKKDGYSIKKKSYSDFTSVMGVKKMNKLEHGGYMADGGELAKYDVSFNYNPSILSNKDAEKIAKKYTKNWEHDNDWDEVSFYVLGLSKENASKLVKELEMQDVYNIEVDKSTYADGGYMAKGGEVENLEKELRKLQRELNSGRLSTYREGDKSEEEMNRKKEREEKISRFNEVLKLLREKDNKMAKGGGIDGQKIAKPSGWRWKNSAVTDGIISESSLYKTPSERMRKMYPDYVDFENRPTKSDKNPSKKFISLETGGQMANGSEIPKEKSMLNFILYEASSGMIANKTNYDKYKDIDGIRSSAISILMRDGDRIYSISNFNDLIQEAVLEYEENKFGYADGGKMAHGGDLEKRVDTLYSTYGFINDDYNWRLKLLEMLQNPSYEAYEIYQSLNEEQKGKVLQELYEMDNDMGSYGDGDIETSKENLEIILDDSKNAKPKFEHGGYMAYGGMLNHGFNVGDKILDIYKGQGIVENNNNGVIEVINPSKGTRFIIGLDDSKRSGRRESVEMTIDEAIKQAKKYIDYTSEGDDEVLDNFVDIIKKYGKTYAKGGGIEDIDMNKVESSALFYTDESKWTPKPTIKKFADEIAEMEKLKKMLDNKEITPSKIIGTGYKSQYVRPLAYRWLNEQILIAKRAIEILQERGHTYANGGELHRLQQ